MSSSAGNNAIAALSEKPDTSERSGKPGGRIHLDFLDGLRGWAALYVMLHHMSMARAGISAQAGLKGLALNWLLYGHLAVDAFIVLSGFCLAIPAARDGHLRGGIPGFYIRRARRILPPFYVALIVFLLIPFIGRNLFHAGGDPFPFNVIAGNALLLQDVFPRLNSIDSPFWSVAVEWKIYFLLPLLLAVWRRGGHAGLLATSAAIGYGILFAVHGLWPDTSLAHTCPWYVFLFGMGVSAGLLSFGEKRPNILRVSQWATLAGLLLAAVLLCLYPITAKGMDDGFNSHLPLVDAAVGFLTASGLVLLTQQYSTGHRPLPLTLLTARPIVAMGTFAYSLYLIHLPVIGYINALLNQIVGERAPAGLQTLLLFTAGSLVILLLSYGFFWLFERPFLNTRKKALKRSLEDVAALEAVP